MINGLKDGEKAVLEVFESEDERFVTVKLSTNSDDEGQKRIPRSR